MKELSCSLRVTAQSERLSFLQRQLFIEPHRAALACKSLSHFQVHDCVYVFVCVRKCHCLNLHGDDVPFSPAPAGIRGRRGGGEEAGGQSLKQRRKNIRCFWCSEKNQTSEEHSAQFTFLDLLRCSIQSEHSNHGNSC